MQIKQNKITGAYYNVEGKLMTWYWYIAFFVAFLVAVAIFDLFFPEVVTSVGVWLSELFR